MAATISLPSSLNPHPHHHRLFLRHHRLLSFPKSPRHQRPPLSSSSSSPSPSSIPSSQTLEDPFRTGRFLTNEELQKLQLLAQFTYHQQLKSGSLSVRVMAAEETDAVVALLAESFGESILMPNTYAALLGFLVKQYLVERRALLPHAATLVGLYKKGDGESEELVELAGTLEVCFDKRGASDSVPSPTPPMDSPYVCNMTVTKPLRRRGIGWHLLKAGEELISLMSSSREVYLHCRIIDEAPFNMYLKAGYSIVKTDCILILLTLQRRKHLMRKELLVSDSPSDFCDFKEELPSLAD